jgi:hypothetical protein
MLQIDEGHLQELRGLSAQEPLPAWAQQIQVATEDPETHGGSIQNNVRAFTGQQLKQSGGSLAMSTVLDGIVEKEQHQREKTSELAVYGDTRPALCAIIWGLCRKGDFLPVDETGDSLELDSVIDLGTLTTTRLKIAEGRGVRDALEVGGFIDSTDTIPDGIVRLQSANDTLASRLESLIEDVELVAESDIETRPVQDLLDSFIDALEAKRQEATDRYEAVKSRDTNWRQVVDATTDAQAWYDDAEEVWTLRLPALTQLDAQFTLAQQSFDWLTDECETARRTLQDRIEEYDGEWWTHDGWDRFNDARTVSPSLADAIEAAWESFRDATDLDAFANALEEHPWVRPPRDFGSNVRPAFETEYITPLRRGASWYEDLSAAVGTVTGSSTGAEADEFIRATDTLVDTPSLDVAAGSGISDLRATFEELQGIVGDRSPAEVTAVGLLPSDRESIEAELERLVDRRELTIERTDAGVVVR